MQEFLSNRLFLTISLIVLAVVIKVFLSKYLKKQAGKEGLDKRYVINTTKNLLNFLLIVSLFLVWIPEIQDFAISIAAFTVAIVLATKEVIQCFIGFIYLTSTRPFRVGDWIQVGELTGEVAETDWAKVTLLEVDMSGYSYTGKSVFIPNNQLMTQAIRNLNYMRRYVNHSFSLTTDIKGFNPFEIKANLLSQAHKYCDEFKEVAERYNSLIEKRLDIKILGPKPEIKIATSDLGKTRIYFSYFCPTEIAKDIEQRLVHDYFNLLQNIISKEDILDN